MPKGVYVRTKKGHVAWNKGLKGVQIHLVGLKVSTGQKKSKRK